MVLKRVWPFTLSKVRVKINRIEREGHKANELECLLVVEVSGFFFVVSFIEMRDVNSERILR